ncbi:VOC family protein [Aggregatilinea lenta]|uniref:VOC family protein n=1 Tax=Aggregatilinea lenta TaxID=913108 RepID=UPI000E5A9BE8|nr:VOC family protein [Aggregatilinea lenta]
MRLRLELFVKSVPESKDFYAHVLGFDVVSYQPDGYSVLRKGDIQIALQAQSQLPDDHPLKPIGNERAGLGIEIVLEVDDLEAIYAHVLHVAWPLADTLAERPWGSRDFRVIDPNGYYIRLNELSTKESHA